MAEDYRRSDGMQGSRKQTAGAGSRGAADLFSDHALEVSSRADATIHGIVISSCPADERRMGTPKVKIHDD
jgi:hypothetical protein